MFILLCGATRALGVSTFWQPVCGLQAAVKAETALASVVATAFILWSLLPTALTLPGPVQLRRVNAKLAAEVEGRRRAEAAYRETGSRLEERIREGTEETDRVNAKLREEMDKGRFSDVRRQND